MLDKDITGLVFANSKFVKPSDAMKDLNGKHAKLLDTYYENDHIVNLNVLQFQTVNYQDFDMEVLKALGVKIVGWYKGDYLVEKGQGFLSIPSKYIEIGGG